VSKFSNNEGSLDDREVSLRMVQLGEAKNLIEFNRVRARAREKPRQLVPKNTDAAGRCYITQLGPILYS